MTRVAVGFRAFSAAKIVSAKSLAMRSVGDAPLPGERSPRVALCRADAEDASKYRRRGSRGDRGSLELRIHEGIVAELTEHLLRDGDRLGEAG
jgi:hypothetical protein